MVGQTNFGANTWSGKIGLSVPTIDNEVPRGSVGRAKKKRNK